MNPKADINTDFLLAVSLASAIGVMFYGLLIAGIWVALRELGGQDAE